jgi:ATP-binding cassette subfamily F protein 3
MNSKKIPGWPVHLSSLYIPQEVLLQPDKTPLEILMLHHDKHLRQLKELNQCKIADLEAELEKLDVSSSEQDAEQMERLCEAISQLEDETGGAYDDMASRSQAREALLFFGADERCWDTPSRFLSGGLQRKVQLAVAYNPVDMLLLDEPTNFLDISGLIQLRRFISTCMERNTIVVVVSHDVDLINDCATDVIHLTQHSLMHYPGNYRDFLGYKRQKDLYRLRECVALQKKRDAMLQTLDHLKKQPVPKRGGSKKKGRAIESMKKKIEKQGIEHDKKGHRWKQQKAGTGIKEGSINSIDASSRSHLPHSELLKRPEADVAPVPDKAVQFVFRGVTSTWGEPLIVATDVGHGYSSTAAVRSSDMELTSDVKKPGFLFDCVDMCINEGSTTCILGANASGKSTLLRLLVKREQPLEGKVHHAHGISIGYFDQLVVDSMLQTDSDSETALSLLTKRFPKKTEKHLRGELTAFGISPDRAVAKIRFLSGGERCRVCLATLMLDNPQILIMDEPSSHLDVESVEALIYGLKHWNGTTVIVSHDVHLIRSLGGFCHVIMPHEGKVRRVVDIDAYIKTFRV